MLSPSDIISSYEWDYWVTKHVINFIESLEKFDTLEWFAEDNSNLIYKVSDSGNLIRFYPTSNIQDSLFLLDLLKNRKLITMATASYFSPSVATRNGVTLVYAEKMAYSSCIDGNTTQHGPTLPIAVCKAIVDYINIARDDAE